MKSEGPVSSEHLAILHVVRYLPAGPVGAAITGTRRSFGAKIVAMALIARQLSSAKKRKDKLVALCESFPEVVTEEHREHLSFKIRKKIFAYYTLDHHGDGMIAFWCKSTMSEQQQLIREDPDVFFKPPYLGPRGWVAMRIDLDTVDWQAAREIVLRAYQETAPKKLAASVE